MLQPRDAASSPDGGITLVLRWDHAGDPLSTQQQPQSQQQALRTHPLLHMVSTVREHIAVYTPHMSFVKGKREIYVYIHTVLDHQEDFTKCN